MIRTANPFSGLRIATRGSTRLPNAAFGRRPMAAVVQWPTVARRCATCLEREHDDGRQASWRDGPPCSRSAVAGARRISRSATAASISTARSAPAATARAILAAASAGDRHRPRPDARSRTAPIWSQQVGGRLTLVEDRFSNLDAVAQQFGHEHGRRRRARSRRLLDAARRGGARLLVPARRSARHAHGRRRPERRRRRRARVASAISPSSSATLGEERHSRAVARPSSRRAREAPIATTAALADDRRHRGARAARPHPSGDADVPGAAHFRQRGTRRTCRGARRGRAHSQAGRPAGRGDLPFARGSHRQDVPGRAQRRARRLAPCAADAEAPPPTFKLARPARRRSPTTPRSRPIRARARPSCAPPSAPRRRRASGRRRRLLPRLPSLADVMRGR